MYLFGMLIVLGESLSRCSSNTIVKRKIPDKRGFSSLKKPNPLSCQ